MHIKQITISNFRSFRQQPEIQPFSPTTNSVVGRNGSGKSNLFDAVQFVLLSPKFFSLRTEERQALLHEGSGSAAVNAFVEIVFDNSDGRFSVESNTSSSSSGGADEVVLRRTVGHKKDEFFLQRRRATKSEVSSLLEGAGFSRSNPYFIVQQGKVNALCTMSDAERLHLLREVAGTTVYDEKKAESLARMEENRSSIEKIDEMLEYIEHRLEELQDEKEELTRYQQLDRDRRAVEYTLYDHELRKARVDLDNLEQTRQDDTEALARHHENAKEIHDRIRETETVVKQRTNALRRVRADLKSLEASKTAKFTAKARLEVEVRELEEGLQSSRELRKRSEKEMVQVRREIDEVRRRLESDVDPKYESRREALASLTTRREEAVQRSEALYEKQNRGRNYETKEERDEALEAQIAEAEAALKERRRELASKRSSLEDLRRKASNEALEIRSKERDLAKKNGQLDEVAGTLEESKKQRNELAEARRNDWRALDELSEKVTEAREEHRRLRSEAQKTTPRATQSGLDALRRIVDEEGLRDGYHGTVMENIELVDDSYRTAVEVAAQNSLFHVIVDTDAVAARLMTRLEKDRAGRVTFLPLNRLREDGEVRYPEGGSDVTPLLSRCLRYRPRVEAAARHVFGRKLLARNVEVAAQWATRCHMDAVTLEGDVCSSKGALTGGYHDVSRSRLKIHADLRAAKDALVDLEARQAALQRKATNLDQDVSRAMSEIQKAEAGRANLIHALARVEDDLESLRQRAADKNRRSAALRDEALPAAEREVATLESQIGRLRDEIGTELSATLSPEERRSLDEARRTARDLEGDIETAGRALEEVSVERERLKSRLDDNLSRRQRELEGILDDGGDSDERGAEGERRRKTEVLESRQRELSEAEREADDLEQRLEDNKTEDERLNAELAASKADLDKLRAADEKNKVDLENVTERGERILTKRSMVVGKRETNMKKIQELGSLPPATELAKYSRLSVSKLMKKLDEINKELKKYSHVNKKAYDQYVNFGEQREGLLDRKRDLDRGAEKVRELVDSLDRKKDEAINRTFRGVSSQFRNVFRELVPAGAGELVMRTDLPDDGEAGRSFDDDDDDGPPPVVDVDSFRGVGVRVRFSAVGENYLMSQLSGGQKALVSLALIFSIQRCDPAPFYLFDELDQALDSTYRAAVANLVARQAADEENPTQFICSTFRPELVRVADSCYGISHQNKVSSIHSMSKKDALGFIANLMSEEEAVQEVSRPSGGGGGGARKRKSSRRSGDDVEEEETGHVTAE